MTSNVLYRIHEAKTAAVGDGLVGWEGEGRLCV